MAGASIKIGASSSEFQKQMKEVTSQLKLVSSECGLASEKAKLFGTTTDQLAAKQKELTSKIQAQNQITQLYKERITGINSEIDKQKSKQIELTSKIEDATKKYKDSCEQTGKSSEESKKLKDELDKLKNQYDKNEESIEAKGRALDNVVIKMNNSEKAILQNEAALEDINTQLANSKLDEFSSKMDKASQSSGAAADKLKPAAAAVTAIGGASVAASITFEDSMAKVSTIADETEVSYDDMKKAIIDLSNETGISANEISDNVYNAISAGQSTGDAVNFVTESTKLAKAGFADAGQSLDLLTTILNAYGMQADNVTNVSDLLIQVQNKGKTTVAELSSSMGKIIPTANSMNVSLDQLGTGYALMTSNGIATAETTTYMNSMLNELGKSGTKVSTVIKDSTGKSFQELMSSGSSLGDVLSLIEQEAGKNGLTLADMFGSAEAGKAALVLAGESGQAFNSMLAEMGQAAGATDTAFDKVSNTTGNSLKTSLNELKNAGINMGDALAPMVSMLAKAFSGLTSTLSGMSQEQLQMVAGVGVAVVAIFGALTAFSKLTAGISGAVTAYKSIKEGASAAMGVIKNFSSKTLEGAKAVGDLAVGLGKSTIEFAKNAVQAGISAAQSVAHKIATVASTVATTALSAAQAALNFIMSLNPITLIVIAIGALVAAIVVLWNKCEWFRELCMGLFESLKVAWDATVQFFISIWDWFVGLWNAAVEGVRAVWESICNVFKLLWDAVCLYFNTIWEVWKNAFTVIANAINAVWDTICNAIKAAWDNIVNGIKIIWQGFIDIWNAAVNGVKSTWETICNVIKAIWDNLTNGISSVWEGVVNGIKSAWEGIKAPFESVVGYITRIWDGIRGMFKLPHFSISGEFSLMPPSIPKVNVDWYYDGGIFTSPTLLGGIGVGDAFNGQGSNAEAIVPLDQMYRNIAQIVASLLQQYSGKGDINLNIDNFNNNREMDIEQLCKELEFYRKKVTY